MLQVIIAIIGCVIGFLITHFKEGDEYSFDKKLGIGLTISGITLFITYMLVAFIAGFTIKYETLPAETYILKEIENNIYFETSTSGNSVSVLIKQDDKTHKFETYDKNIVSFEKGETAQVIIVKEKNNWNETKEFWFDVGKEAERIKSVTIIVPNESNEVVTQENNFKFCTKCGEKRFENWNYCATCGDKLNYE